MTVHGNTFWEIIKPSETTNLVQNPSIETNATGYAGASGATTACTAASQFFGSHALQVTPTSASSDGVYYGADSLSVALTNGSTYAFSLFFKGQTSVPYSIYFADTSGGLVGSSLDFTATGDWERQSVTYAATTASRRLYVTKNDSADTGAFIIDGLQCEVVEGSGASPTTYCDGDQDGCIWLAQEHASQSWRDGESRAGGEIINLNRDYDIIVRQQPGAGMPPVENVATNLGIQDGGLYQRTKTQTRSFSLEGVVTGSDVSDFHFNRNRLLDLFKPDGGNPQQSFLLRYTTGSSIAKQIKAHYDGGFELSQVDAEIEQFSLRLIAYEPYWEEIKDTAQQLTSQAALSAGGVIRKPTGHRGNEGDVFTTADYLTSFTYNPLDGKLYFADRTGDERPRRYNFQTEAIEDFVPTTSGCLFHASGGTDNGVVWGVKITSVGDFYIFGFFDGAGSTNASNIVKWDGNDYIALGDSLRDDDAAGGGTVYDVEVDERNNTVYAGGAFNISGSITACGVAKFVSGATEWAPVGDGFKGTDWTAQTRVTNIELEKGGSNLYISGSWDSAGSVTGASGLAYFNGVEYEVVGNASFNGRVETLHLFDDDTLLIGGQFTGTFPDSAGSPQYFTHWDKNNYTIGADNSPGACVYRMSHNSETGETLVGLYDNIDNTNLADGGPLVIWNGTVWKHGPFNYDYSVSGPLDVFYQNGVYAAHSGSAGSKPVVATVNNPGTATVQPKIIWALPSTTASNTLFYIENISASKDIQFNYTILGGETVTLDTQNGTIQSNTKGSIIGNILPGSNFATWHLQPGDNVILPLANSTNTSLFLQWKNRYWSIDGGES